MPKKPAVASFDEEQRFTAAALKAIRELDYEQFESLAYMRGTNSRAREEFETLTRHLLSQFANLPRLKVKLVPKSKTPINYVTGLTLSFTHLLDITAKNAGVSYYVGVKNGRLYISVARYRPPPVELDAETVEWIEKTRQAMERDSKRGSKA